MNRQLRLILILGCILIIPLVVVIVRIYRVYNYEPIYVSEGVIISKDYFPSNNYAHRTHTERIVINVKISCNGLYETERHYLPVSEWNNVEIRDTFIIPSPILFWVSSSHVWYDRGLYPHKIKK